MFDVIIRTSKRLSIIDPTTNQDILLGEHYLNGVNERITRAIDGGSATHTIA